MSSKQRDDPMVKALKLVGLTAIRGLKQREQVEVLSRAGYGQTEIAELLDSTPKAISVRLAEIRKGKKKKDHPETRRRT